MKKKMKNIVIVLVCGMFAAPIVQSAPETKSLVISKAYVRAVPAGMDTTAAYLTIANRSDNDVVVTKISSKTAESVEIHNAVVTNGMMKMSRMDSIIIPAHGETKFTPGGLHIMLIGIKQNLKPETHIPITLTTQNDVELLVSAQVKDMRHGSEHQHHR